MTKELWQTWCMRRTENPENVVRIHKVPPEDGQIRLTSNGITSISNVKVLLVLRRSVTNRRIITIFLNGAVCILITIIRSNNCIPQNGYYWFESGLHFVPFGPGSSVGRA